MMTTKRAARIVLQRLNARELNFVAQIMNTVSDGDWLGMEEKTERELARSQRFICAFGGEWGDPLKTPYGKERVRVDGSERAQAPKQWAKYHLQQRWKVARDVFTRILVEQRDSPGFLCPLPSVALPEKKPRFLIHDPEDLAMWLTARLAANRQWHAIVKCERCTKFGVHARARRGMKYCTDCKAEANRDRAIKRYQSEQRYPLPEVRRYAQLNRLEKKAGKLSAPLRLEKWKIDVNRSGR